MPSQAPVNIAGVEGIDAKIQDRLGPAPPKLVAAGYAGPPARWVIAAIRCDECGWLSFTPRPDHDAGIGTAFAWCEACSLKRLWLESQGRTLPDRPPGGEEHIAQRSELDQMKADYPALADHLEQALGGKIAAPAAGFPVPLGKVRYRGRDELWGRAWPLLLAHSGAIAKPADPEADWSLVKALGNRAGRAERNALAVFEGHGVFTSNVVGKTPHGPGDAASRRLWLIHKGFPAPDDVACPDEIDADVEIATAIVRGEATFTLIRVNPRPVPPDAFRVPRVSGGVANPSTGAAWLPATK